MCGPKEYHGFSAVLVINRVWFLHSFELGTGIFLKEAVLFIIIDKKINKSPL